LQHAAVILHNIFLFIMAIGSIPIVMSYASGMSTSKRKRL
jgi:hypothetical protein